MQFLTKEDIEAPIEAVFAAISDFEGFERAALRRGVRAQRIERKARAEALLGWEVEAKFRDKTRTIKADLVEFDTPNQMQMHSVSGGMQGTAKIELVALSKNRTRLSVDTELKPKSLTARLMLQTMRLAKTKMTKRFKLRVARFAEDIEDRYKSGQLS